MNSLLDTSALRAEVQSRLAIGIDLELVVLDGCEYYALRPSDLERGHGFFVAIAQTPKQMVASFHFDAYAGRLFRMMADSDDLRKRAMTLLVSNADQSGLSAYCAIEDSHALASRPEGSSWKSLEIEVSGRTSGRNNLQQLAADVASYAFAIPLCLVQIEEIEPSELPSGEAEGSLQRSVVNKYERSPSNRAACIAFHGAKCKSCGFDFEAVYGEIGAGFIEVHHTVPVSTMGDNYIVDPIKELIPLCSNCHSMVHRRSPPLDLLELKNVLAMAQQA